MSVDFFKPTKAEVDSAKNGDKAVFKDKEEIVFQINEIKGKVSSKGDSMTIIDCKVLSGENASKEHAFFIFDRPNSKKVLFNMITALFGEEKLLSGEVTPALMVGKQVKSVCRVSTKGDQTYYNFDDFVEQGGVPGGFDSAPTTEAPTTVITQDDIPF